MNEMEMVSFQIISAVGSARSCYIEAIHEAKEGHYEQAQQLIKDGEEMFAQGHHVHLELLAKMANGEKLEYDLLLLHAEDQLMSAETFGILAREFMTVYKTIKGE